MGSTDVKQLKNNTAGLLGYWVLCVENGRACTYVNENEEQL